MTATETITSNPRVLGADPLVVYDPKTKTLGGIGEEDLVVITLPYIHSAREGVIRLGELSMKYGTYEMNGIAFADENEIWWFESIGGHNWMAKESIQMNTSSCQTSWVSIHLILKTLRAIRSTIFARPLYQNWLKSSSGPVDEWDLQSKRCIWIRR